MALYYVELKTWGYGVAVGVAAAVGVAMAVGCGATGALTVLVAWQRLRTQRSPVPMVTRGVRVARGVGGVVGKMVPMRVK